MTSLEKVKKHTAEFKAACQRYLKLMDESKETDFIRKGVMPDNKYLGLTSKKILEAKLPMPFGCPDLFIQACFETIDKGKLTENQLCTGIIWFCDRIGCICVCCREDFEEEWPEYCPNPLEMQGAEMDNYEEDSEDRDDWEEDFEPDW